MRMEDSTFKSRGYLGALIPSSSLDICRASPNWKVKTDDTGIEDRDRFVSRGIETLEAVVNGEEIKKGRG